METGKLKKFAQFARRSLIQQIQVKLKLVLAEGSAARRENANAVKELEEQVKSFGNKQVIERVAYTWFNRFCALRFMDVNRYTRIGILSPVDGQFQPEILAEAKMGHIDEEMVPRARRQRIMALLDGSAPSSDPQSEAYQLLLVAACNHYHKLMPFMFEKIVDYTELLIPDDLLSGNSILAYTREALLSANCSPEYTDESVEVIGWLYQFYISEKKDEVFAALKKGKKITPENIPAATQLFTPHWIVRYLVENSLGRLWMLNHPESRLVERMDYYIEPEEVVSGKCGVGSQGETDDSQELQRASDLAEVDGLGADGLRSDKTVSEGGNLRADEPGASGGGFDSVEYRRGSSEEVDSRVQELSLDRSGFEGGSRNADSDSSAARLHNSGENGVNSVAGRGDQANDSFSREQAELTSHSPLSTSHSPQDFLRISSPEEIKICDPACGSGHMLTYAFDLLYAIYEEQGYQATDIPRLILTHNLYGIEIDQRAGALAAFALTMKAREKDRRFFSRKRRSEKRKVGSGEWRGV